LNAEPQRRGLSEQSGPGGARYWTFPPDYRDRVLQLFKPAPTSRPGSTPPGTGQSVPAAR